MYSLLHQKLLRWKEKNPVDRITLPTINSHLTANKSRAMLAAGYRRLRHPITGRFVGEYNAERGLLKVVDRGKTAVIDLKDIPAD